MDDIRRPLGGELRAAVRPHVHLPRADSSSTPQRNWGTIALLCVAGALLAIGVSALFAPQFQIERIRVEGGNELLRTEAETLAKTFVEREAVLAGKPRLFLVPRDRLAETLRAALPELATVQVLRRLPATLELNLQEKVAVAFLEVGGRTFSLASEGQIIAEVSPEDARRAELPRVRDLHTATPVRAGDQVLNQSVVQLLHEVIVKLPEEFSVSVEELIIPAIGTEEVHVRTSGGWNILLDARRSLTDQLGALEKVVTEELDAETLQRLEYIDLRIPGKVFYNVK
ncbi:MAG: FtsQ-type POTRA domain-containing protein [bacterium]|nr:FtsQ-type POTRA domain-containing protein [bacterium]